MPVPPGSGTAPLWADTRAASGPAGDGSSAADVPTVADVVVVGGGFTGLWTAYYLLRERPDLSVLVLEAEHVGFGASGRNGGWVSALWPVSPDTLAARSGRAATLAHLAALRDTVDEIGRVDADEGLGGGFVKGGTLALARTPAQEERARAAVAHAASWDEGLQWLGPDAARERLAADGVRGATFTPHCARVQPRDLVDGLAAAVRRRGGLVVEGVRVARAGDGVAVLEDGRRVTAGAVVLATEGWTARLPGHERAVVPVYSLMVATEPLSAQRWQAIGLAEREVFTDHGHLVIYGQRTVDDRIAFGGRGAPYHLGSAIRPSFDHEEAVFASLRSTLTGMLPALAGVRFTHAWGGPLGIPRDWHPSVTWDPVTRTGRAGGYVGDGVAATNLAGRTLADLVLGRSSALTALPWVGHRSPSWEPEPLRWLGVNAGLRLARLADRDEARSGRPSRLAPLLARLTGGH
ncbi:FAD-binding oxidoreductase [Nostocoides sp. Soil756]|uniref:NAD(P)/FAD-dependent oxidoreductase n=1 Tax=Nostocoides sp. Soil756 TaxID=1736399 RepID=UPI0006FDB9FA|nr:FAD-binding oxidoreductase [Tetrasphaera sp. Soil756]KRE61645.1 FAD-dependent oxidoreductase [Tetrasphaera sp. Soil756]